MIDQSAYKDIDLIPSLIDEISNFVSNTDLDVFLKNVGEVTGEGLIGWKFIMPYDATNNHKVDDNLQIAASSIIDIAKTIPNLKRITINFLDPMSALPMHQDDEKNSCDYNMIIPITDNGWFFLDGKVFKSDRHKKFIFDGSVWHGAMNDSFEDRITVFLLIDKDRFDINAQQ